ncbi:glycosyltransferase family 2 protein [Providencia vermicola]|uniref:glycosyltransferase family 2 protein n=1 Tax=Providencia vermicola TaxID=333965 RepID=UPI0034DD8F7E
MCDVSVVIPYYNDSPVFERCLKSVVLQSLKPKEIIIIDDCSTDSEKLKVIINNYIILDNNINILYFRNIENKNGAYSRNKGISLCSSSYIALLDADDYWHKNHLELSINTLVTNHSDFVFSNVIYVNYDGTEKRRKVTDPKNIKNKFDILLKSPPQTNSFVFKKKVREKIKFNEKLRRHQDYQYILDVLKKDIDFTYIDIYTSYYCASHRSLKTRLHYSSMLYFWDNDAFIFTKKTIKKHSSNLIFKSLVDSELLMSDIEKNYPNLIKLIKGNICYKLQKKIGSNNKIKAYFLFCLNKLFLKITF